MGGSKVNVIETDETVLYGVMTTLWHHHHFNPPQKQSLEIRCDVFCYIISLIITLDSLSKNCERRIFKLYLFRPRLEKVVRSRMKIE